MSQPDSRNLDTIREAELEEDEDVDDAEEADFGDAAPARPNSWTVESDLKCNRQETNAGPIKQGRIILRRAMGTANTLTYFLTFFPSSYIESCLDDINCWNRSNNVKDCPDFTMGELYVSSAS